MPAKVKRGRKAKKCFMRDIARKIIHFNKATALGKPKINKIYFVRLLSFYYLCSWI